VFVVVALVLLLVLPWPWDIVGFGVGLVCFAAEVVYWHRRVRGHRLAVGAHTLVGEVGTVMSACRPSGQVSVLGEIWGARCDAGADVGDAVAVVGRNRLTLVVEQTRQTTGTHDAD
jgi:membrane protein implicated in regulation of membrane protease activity